MKWILVAALLLLGGCYHRIESETSQDGYADAPNGPIVVASHRELSERPYYPMEHSGNIRTDSAAYRAWQLDLGGETLRVKEIPVDYSYRRSMFGGESAPWRLLPLDGGFVPMDCIWQLPWQFAGSRIRCSQPPAKTMVTVLGARPLHFQLTDTRLSFGRNGRCTVDLERLNPLAGKPIIERIGFIEMPVSRFGLARIDAERAYLTDVSQPGIALYLLDCGKVSVLGSAFSAKEAADAAQFGEPSLFAIDVVPDGSLTKPAVLRSVRVADGKFAMSVTRADGRILPVDKFSAFDIVCLSTCFEAPSAAFLAGKPDLLLGDVRALFIESRIEMSIVLYDPARRKRIERKASVSDDGAWPRP